MKYKNFLYIILIFTFFHSAKCFKKNSFNSLCDSILNKVKLCFKTQDDVHLSALDCLKTSSNNLLDNILAFKEITLADGIKFVQQQHQRQEEIKNETSNSTGKRLAENFQLIAPKESYARKYSAKRTFNLGKNTIGQFHLENFKFNKTLQGYQNFKSDSWREIISRKIHEFLNNFVLQINFSNLLSDKFGHNDTDEVVGRHRRHRNNMMVAMMFGVSALGTIIVPLGFQFLAAISGKALLLAKMALLLASVNGIKRIAATGVHYGLYHVPENMNYGYNDRGDRYQPRHF